MHNKATESVLSANQTGISQFQTFVADRITSNRVESGSDDPDNVGHLGHFFDGSSGSHLQTKLSGCDPDFLVH